MGVWWPRGLLTPLSISAFFFFFFFWTSVYLIGMCCSFQHGCTQQFVACWVVLLHCWVVLASFCWEITGGHIHCQENVGIVRETGIVLVAMNSDLLMVGLMKSVSGTLHSSMMLTMSMAWTPVSLASPWAMPAWSSQIDPRYLASKCFLNYPSRKVIADTDEKKGRKKKKRRRGGKRKEGGKKEGENLYKIA